MKEKVRSQICWQRSADIIVRFQGGANAGHTIVNNYGKVRPSYTSVRRFL